MEQSDPNLPDDVPLLAHPVDGAGGYAAVRAVQRYQYYPGYPLV
jgi:hypothetical protein